jgi:hypothetical protein
MTHHRDIFHDGELELIPIFCEVFLEVFSFVERSDNAPDSVAFLQEDIDDVNGEEPVCTSDEDFISRSDGRHDSQSFCGSENVGKSQGICSTFRGPPPPF